MKEISSRNRGFKGPLALTGVFIALFCGFTRGQDQSPPTVPALPYCIVDTGQKHLFDNQGQLLKAPKLGKPYFGQDGFYRSAPSSYRLSKDGLTVYDNNTGLTWQSSPGIDLCPHILFLRSYPCGVSQLSV